MFKIIETRIQQGFHTPADPFQSMKLSDRFQGLPLVNHQQCPSHCQRCVEVCPTQAIEKPQQYLNWDLGKCLFCTECMDHCPEKAIQFSNDVSLSSTVRSDLTLSQEHLKPQVKVLETKMRRIFGRSLKLRQVSAGGCNACEQDINVLNTLVFDWARFGIQLVASPRHADGLLITGAITQAMVVAIQKTYEAIPNPKWVIAIGACAISGGPYSNHPQVLNGIESLLKVDLYIPGCPPHPLTILDGLLRWLGKMELLKK